MFCCVIIFFVTSFLFLVCLHFVRIFLRVGLENDLSYWNIHCHPDRFAVTFQYNQDPPYLQRSASCRSRSPNAQMSQVQERKHRTMLKKKYEFIKGNGKHNKHNRIYVIRKIDLKPFLPCHPCKRLGSHLEQMLKPCVPVL